MEIKKIQETPEPDYPDQRRSRKIKRFAVAIGGAALITGAVAAAALSLDTGEKIEVPRLGGSLAVQPQQVSIRPIYFDADESAIRPDQEATLKQWAQTAAATTQTLRLMIAAYCDDAEIAKYQFELGKQRGEAIKKYLVEHGISSERIVVIPLFPFQTEDDNAQENRKKQRRAELNGM